MRINIILASDENYLDKLAVTASSIIKNNNCEISFHLFLNNVSEESRDKIVLFLEEFNNVYVNAYNMDNLSDLLGIAVNVDHLSLATYARLFISKILPSNIDKALYLDVDIIVKNELSTLFDIDIDAYLIAGVESLIDRGNQHQINAGVILWNLKKCREYKFDELCVNLIKTKGGKMKFHDQTIINEVCAGKILLLPPKYNAMSPHLIYSYERFKAIFNLQSYYDKSLFCEAQNNPTVVHLTAWVVGRPWHTDSKHPYKKDFLNILESTPWSNVILKSSGKGFKTKLRRTLYKILPKFVLKTIRKRKV